MPGGVLRVSKRDHLALSQELADRREEKAPAVPGGGLDDPVRLDLGDQLRIGQQIGRAPLDASPEPAGRLPAEASPIRLRELPYELFRKRGGRSRLEVRLGHGARAEE